MANVSKSSKIIKAPEKMYQHAIPRFILRQFDVSYEPLPSQSVKVHEVWKSCQKFHSVYFYNLANGQLTVEDLGSVYGENNLYRNQKEPRDVDYLEHKLGKLEQLACSAIQAIHYGMPHSTVSFTRAELASLRKFVFLTHYRSAAASVTYFCEEDPRNAPLVDWIENLKASHGLETEVDIWKEGLKYYLDTPHEDIVAAGQVLRNMYGEKQLHRMLQERVDPDLEEWYAIDYETQARDFSLSIWQAAPGAEFVLSENGSGIWDGLIYGSPGTHKIYVVSPRIALVLRRNRDPSEMRDDLDAIPISQARLVCHPDTKGLARPVGHRNPPNGAQDSDDKYLFKFTKLSFDETYSVNEVLLNNANVKQHGSITFLSHHTMFHTLQRFMSSDNPAPSEEKRLFQPLLETLTSSESKKAY